MVLLVINNLDHGDRRTLDSGDLLSRFSAFLSTRNFVGSMFAIWRALLYSLANHLVMPMQYASEYHWTVDSHCYCFARAFSFASWELQTVLLAQIGCWPRLTP